MARGINRYAPSLTTSGVVICDTDLSGGNGNDKPIGPSTYGFLPAGWVIGSDGVPIMQTPNIALSQTVNANASFVFNSTSLVNIGLVFPGQPVQIQVQGIAAVAGAVVTLFGFNGENPVTEILTFNNLAAVGLKTQISANSYTSLQSASVSTQSLTNATISTVYLKTNSGQPFLAAALDINSTSGSFLPPKMSSSDIASLDTTSNQNLLANVQNNVPVAYATTDGMQVYNKTTGAISTKRNGVWDNFYLEDPFRTQMRRASLVLNQTQILVLGAAATWLRMTGNPPSFPQVNGDSSIANNIAITVVNQEILAASIALPYPMTIQITNTINAINIYTISGIYNGINVKDVITTGALGNKTSLLKFSTISSIKVTTFATADNIKIGYGASSATLIPYRLSLQSFNATAFTSAGDPKLGLAYAKTNVNQLMPLQDWAPVLGVSANTTTSVYVSQMGIVSTASSLANAPLYFGADVALTGGGTVLSQLIVGLEYEIIW